MSSSLEFPDLRLILDTNSTDPGALGKCAAAINTIVAQQEFARSSFDTATREALRDYQSVSLQEGDLSKNELTSTRLRVLGQEALRLLYPNDATLRPLLHVLDQLEAARDNDDRFSKWMSDQRNSGRIGFYPLFPQDLSQLETWKVPPSTPSERRPVGPPSIGLDGGLYLHAENARGRSIIIVRCRSDRDPSCSQQFIRAVCNRPIDDVLAAPTGTGNGPSRLQCRPISPLGLLGWIGVEAGDEQSLRSFRQALVLGRSINADFDLSLIEYAVLVRTKHDN